MSGKGGATDDLYKELYELSAGNFGQKSEFNCFVNACDTTLNLLKKDYNIFVKIVDLYIKHRSISEYSPQEWIQALIDKGASRAKGIKGEAKLIKLATQYGFKEVFSWEEFKKEEKAVVKFSKNKFDLLSIKNSLGINLDFHSQNKMLDLIIKSGKKVIFLEAKHLKESGGSQDKQVHELINIISTPCSEKNVYYGAFLDGFYSNVLLENIDNQFIETPNVPKNNKIMNQKYEVVKALKKNHYAFWFNTAGFIEFIKEF